MPLRTILNTVNRFSGRAVDRFVDTLTSGITIDLSLTITDVILIAFGGAGLLMIWHGTRISNNVEKSHQREQFLISAIGRENYKNMSLKGVRTLQPHLRIMLLYPFYDREYKGVARMPRKRLIVNTETKRAYWSPINDKLLLHDLIVYPIVGVLYPWAYRVSWWAFLHRYHYVDDWPTDEQLLARKELPKVNASVQLPISKENLFQLGVFSLERRSLEPS